VAWSARQIGVPATVVVPEHAPETKLAAIERLGGRYVKVPFEQWWQVLTDHGAPGYDGLFIHPVADTAVMAGNGTIGLEILEDLPDVDTVLVPIGGGGLVSGIATAIRAGKPDTRVYACEVETAAPLTAALAAGGPQTVDYRPSFVDGIGGKRVLGHRRQRDDAGAVTRLFTAATSRRAPACRQCRRRSSAGSRPSAGLRRRGGGQGRGGLDLAGVDPGVRLAGTDCRGDPGDEAAAADGDEHGVERPAGPPGSPGRWCRCRPSPRCRPPGGLKRPS